MRRSRFSWAGVVTILLLLWAPVHADVPLLPSSAAIKSCSLNGRFCLSRAAGSEMLRLYEIDALGKKTPRWEVRSTASIFQIANDGVHWVEIFEGANLLPLEALGTTVMLTFHRRAETITRVELRHLVQEFNALPQSTDHRVWAQSYGFDQKGRFTLRTAESIDFLFDASTGQPTNRSLFP